mmetsp:Transcript_54497/g.100325  ORF Transcript_54497/g.100325 Transcript_54497/m.100325 type:complete len:161 (+) Transcript_54497:90-572(+)
MWRPDPGACVAEPREFGSLPDDLEYMKLLKGMPKRILKKREIIAKDSDLKKAKTKQEKISFSVIQFSLSMYSRSSGLGDEKSSIVQVFYESKDERKVLNAFSSSGIDLESAEAMPVDPASSVQVEQMLMYKSESLWLDDPYEYEEREKPLSMSEVSSRFT